MAGSVLEKLITKHQQIEARIKLLKARDVTQKRKDDTRKKILVGSYFLNKMEKEGGWGELVQEMNAFLTRPQDRLLFGLEVKEDDKKVSSG